MGRMKPRYMRLATAVVCSPLAGLLVSHFTIAIEHAMYGQPAYLDNGAYRAHELVGPLLKPAFVIVCWFYVIPASWLLTRFWVYESS